MKDLEKTTELKVDGLFSHYTDRLNNIGHFLLGIDTTKEESKMVFINELKHLYYLQRDIQKKRRKLVAPALTFASITNIKADKLDDKVISIEKFILNKIKIV